MVNINDREAEPYPENDTIWMAIYDEQLELHHKYRKIEWDRDLGYGIMKADGEEMDTPRHIDSPFKQAYIKDLMWRFTEEMQEAKEALILGHQEHFHEELIDALHFMMELNVVIDTPKTKLFTGSGIPGVDSIYFYGLAANCLKNKPWKQTNQMTDINKFNALIRQGNNKFRFELLHNLDLEEIWNLYSKKRQVNEFRIGSSY